MKAPIHSEAEFAQAIAFASTMTRPSTYRLMLLFSRKLGLRPMELAGLDASWFRGNELRIPLGHSKRKGGRSLPTSPELLEALREHLQGRQGAVFLTATGQPFDARGISSAMRRLYREAGMIGSCYSGRRSLATRLVDEGTNILVIQKMLGHASPLTTMQYCEVSDGMMRRAMFG